MNARHTLLLDSNLAVLLVVGLADRRLIASHRALKSFDDHDFNALRMLVEASDRLVWCPHVFTETSNLARQIGGPAKRLVTMVLGDMIASSDERQMASSEDVTQEGFLRLGLTDAILVSLTQQGAQLLTTDLDLHLSVLAAGKASVNFNDLRNHRPGFA